MLSPTKLNRSLSHQAGQGNLSHQVAPGGGTGTHLTGTPGTPVPAGQRINGFLTPTTPAQGGPSTPMRHTPAAASDKPGGPPIRGLFSTPNHLRADILASPHTPSAAANTTPMPSTPHLSFGGTPKVLDTTASDLNQR